MVDPGKQNSCLVVGHSHPLIDFCWILPASFFILSVCTPLCTEYLGQPYCSFFFVRLEFANNVLLPSLPLLLPGMGTAVRGTGQPVRRRVQPQVHSTAAMRLVSRLCPPDESTHLSPGELSCTTVIPFLLLASALSVPAVMVPHILFLTRREPPGLEMANQARLIALSTQAELVSSAGQLKRLEHQLGAEHEARVRLEHEFRAYAAESRCIEASLRQEVAMLFASMQQLTTHLQNVGIDTGAVSLGSPVSKHAAVTGKSDKTMLTLKREGDKKGDMHQQAGLAFLGIRGTG